MLKQMFSRVADYSEDWLQALGLLLIETVMLLCMYLVILLTLLATPIRLLVMWIHKHVYNSEETID